MDTLQELTTAVMAMSMAKYTRELITNDAFYGEIMNLIESSGGEMPLPRQYMDKYQEVHDAFIAVEMDEIDVGGLPREISLTGLLAMIQAQSMMPVDIDEDDIETILESDWVIIFGFGEIDPQIEYRDGDDIAMWWKNLNTVDKKISFPSWLDSLGIDEMGETYIYKNGEQVVINLGFIVWAEKVNEGDKE